MFAADDEALMPSAKMPYCGRILFGVLPREDCVPMKPSLQFPDLNLDASGISLAGSGSHGTPLDRRNRPPPKASPQLQNLSSVT
jgi:hypothetical protein